MKNRSSAGRLGLKGCFSSQKSLAPPSVSGRGEAESAEQHKTACDMLSRLGADSDRPGSASQLSQVEA